MPQKPRQDESKEEFLNRCHSYMTKNDEGENASQKLAICHSMWRNKNKETRHDSLDKNHDRVFCFQVDSQPSTMHTDKVTGFLHCKGVFTRSGVFDYYDDEGNLIRELRPEEEVFDENSLKSLQMVPITDQHPSEMITVDNVKDYLIGMIGENIHKENEYVTGNMIITDKDMIETIKDRKDSGLSSALSGGYNCKLIKENGVHDKDGNYDYKQTQIRYNHLSIVPAGRAGKNVRIMDSKNKDDGSKKQKEDKMPELVKFIKGEIKLDNFKVDAISCEITEDALSTVELLSDKLDEAIVLINSLTSEKDGLQGKVDQSNETITTLNTDIASLKDPNSQTIIDMVKARRDLEDLAAKLEIDIKDKKMQESKIDCIKKISPNFDSKEKSVDYINARFDAVVETVALQKNDEDKNALGQFNKDSKNADGTIKLNPREEFLKKDAENRK